jgi:RNA polymerase sigma-70 factor (ECF subfamily)
MQDASLMTDIPGQARLSFDAAVRQRETQVLRIAYRMVGNWADAEDIAQEAFVRLHRQGVSGFPDEASLGAWLCRVTANLCLDRLRTRARWRMTGIVETTSPNSSAEADTLREERKHLLMTALRSLPERERAALVLREIEGLSTMEAAKALGSSEGTIRSQVSKALARLRVLLTKEMR